VLAAVAAPVEVEAVICAEPDGGETRMAFRGPDEEHPDVTSTQAAIEQATEDDGSRRRYTELLHLARGLATPSAGSNST
jgi:hypothetical protein